MLPSLSAADDSIWFPPPEEAVAEYDGLLNDLALAKDLISEKAALVTPVSPTPLMGAEGYMSVVAMMRSSFPDVRWRLEDMVADEKTVAVCWL